MNFKISRGKYANLPEALTDGNTYFCTDTGELFIDIENERIQVNAANTKTLMNAALEQNVSGNENKIPSSKAISDYIDNNSILYIKEQKLTDDQLRQIKQNLDLPIKIVSYWENKGTDDLQSLAFSNFNCCNKLLICLAQDFTTEQKTKFKPPLLITEVYSSLAGMAWDGKVQTADGKIYMWDNSSYDGSDPDSTWATIIESERYDSVVDSVNGITPINGDIITQIIIVAEQDEEGNWFGKVNGEIKSQKWYQEQINKGITNFILGLSSSVLCPCAGIFSDSLFFVNTYTNEEGFVGYRDINFNFSNSSINIPNDFLALLDQHSIPYSYFINATKNEQLTLKQSEISTSEYYIENYVLVYNDENTYELLEFLTSEENQEGTLSSMTFFNINHKITLTCTDTSVDEAEWTITVEEANPIFTPPEYNEAGKAGLVPAPPINNKHYEEALLSNGSWVNLNPQSNFNSKTLEYTWPAAMYGYTGIQRTIFYDEKITLIIMINCLLTQKVDSLGLELMVI